MSSNPYQPFFDKLDRTVEELEVGDPDKAAATAADAIDVLRRAGFVLGNLINAQSQVYPMLFLPAEQPEPATDGADTPSLEQPESVVQDDL